MNRILSRGSAWRRVILVFAVSLVMNGCADLRTCKIEKDKTTRQELIDRFGQPNDRVGSDGGFGGEMLQWERFDNGWGTGNVRLTVLVENGVVVGYTHVHDGVNDTDY